MMTTKRPLRAYAFIAVGVVWLYFGIEEVLRELGMLTGEAQHWWLALIYIGLCAPFMFYLAKDP